MQTETSNSALSALLPSFDALKLCPNPMFYDPSSVFNDFQRYLSLGLKKTCGVKFEQPFLIEKIKRAFFLVANPSMDPTGAGTRDKIGLQAELLKRDGYEVQAAHLNDVKDFPKIIRNAFKKLPKGEKIDLLSIYAHGNRNELALSHFDPTDSPKLWEIGGLSKPSKVFKHLYKNATIILNSCDAGQPPFSTSFAAYLSRISERTVVASQGLVSGFLDVKGILSNIKKGKPLFSASCHAFNLYKGGDLYFKSVQSLEFAKDCLKSYHKMNLAFGITQSYESEPLRFSMPHQPGFVQHLLDAGVDANAVMNDGYSPLTLAIRQYPSFVPALLKAGANVDADMGGGHTPLTFAIMLQPRVVPALIDAGARVNFVMDDGHTPLALAILKQPSAVQSLINAGAHVNIRGRRGHTPLTLAIMKQPIVIQTLIDAGADLNAALDNGYKPLAIALMFQPDVAPLLQKALEKERHLNHQ